MQLALSPLDHEQLDNSRTPPSQDGRMRIALEEKDYGLRVSIMPTVHGENRAALLDKSNLSAASTSSPDPDTFQQFRRRRCAPWLILVTGPTGSGQNHHSLFRPQ